MGYVFDRITPNRPSIDYENKSGFTALSMACMHGHLEVVRDLLDRGADVNRKSLISGQTPLMCACLAGNLEVVKLLISRQVGGWQGSELDLQGAYDVAVRDLEGQLR